MKAPIILAVDTADYETAVSWIQATQEYIPVYKLGLEFYLNFGSAGISKIIAQTGVEIFLDLKLHDIPKTVAGAAKAIEFLHPKFLTVHASGGSSMIKAAVQALPEVNVAAVTILTSLSEPDLFEIGFANSALQSAVALAKLAVGAGAKAIVCSPLETAAIRSAVGPDPIIITPGVRSRTEAGGDDQARTMVARDGILQGANYVVIGRPITGMWAQGGAEGMRVKAALFTEEILG